MSTAAEDRERLGDAIAYGLRHTGTCLVTDAFTDPYISKYVMNKLDPKHEATMQQTWIGEVIGDLSALGIFIGAQYFFPTPMKQLKETLKTTLDPIYDSLGKRSINQWALRHDIAPDSEKYKKKLEQWKEYQADTLAKSAVISLVSIPTNVIAQKYLLKNPHRLNVITLAKMIGAGLTMTGMATMQLALPKTMHEFDEELNHNYFSPIIRRVQRAAGVDEIETKEFSLEDEKQHTRKIRPRISATQASTEPSYAPSRG